MASRIRLVAGGVDQTALDCRFLKDIFKGAATTVITRRNKDRIHACYERLLDGGTRPTLGKLSLARMIAAIVLRMWKNEEEYDPERAGLPAKTREGLATQALQSPAVARRDRHLRANNGARRHRGDGDPKLRHVPRRERLLRHAVRVRAGRSTNRESNSELQEAVARRIEEGRARRTLRPIRGPAACPLPVPISSSPPSLC